mmetsp:Transcript_16161/g.28418  ORF Transcript_16161/g.28418 Transcript_16161/m.28418 type:complete len:170 (+) Transcript_16161:15-524(+)
MAAQGVTASYLKALRVRPVKSFTSLLLGHQKRGISSSFPRFHGHDDHDVATNPLVSLHFKSKKGMQTVKARVGMNVMRVAHANNIELEGACEGVIACSTCHVVLEGALFDRLAAASEEEEDMLDQAPGLTPTSRLGCQVEVTEDMEGATITLPAITRNFYVDGHVPQPH